MPTVSTDPDGDRVAAVKATPARGYLLSGNEIGPAADYLLGRLKAGELERGHGEDHCYRGWAKGELGVEAMETTGLISGRDQGV